jgi:hypothetical protein
MRAILSLAAGLLAAAAAHGQYYGTPAPYSPPPPSIGEAPAWLKYTSPRCAALHDSIRTGPARGLSGQTINAARKEYDRECRDDERDAMQQLGREQQDKRAQKTAEKQVQVMTAERARQHEQQCGEAKRILKIKKARTDLSDGEKADLKRFEDNYIARCS